MKTKKKKTNTVWLQLNKFVVAEDERSEWTERTDGWMEVNEDAEDDVIEKVNIRIALRVSATSAILKP